MSAQSSDRNLLFGILALQMDFITRDALIAAMNAWALEKSMPLGEILVARGALSESRRALLEPLVDEHVRQHGGDPRQSLATLSSIGPVREALEQVPDPDVQASLAAVASARLDTAGSADPYATHIVTLGAPTSGGTRFVILRPHDRGGLGQVYVARDTELDRPVALKEILLHRADEPSSRERFVAEAEITGKLEHPGIVPVYGLGHYPDGRPFYAMRFIKGRSLKEAIASFHGPDGPPSGSTESTLKFRELLNRFLDVCDAVAYAHRRGVLHRDLKPGNVMLGPFGETLVVDWGLAKTLGSPSGPDDAYHEPVRLSSLSGSHAETLAGSPIGTPAYASPELVEGRLDLLGPATDVYGLGAILYSLLTGHAPIESSTLDETLRRSIAGDVPGPRTHDPAIPRPLESICLKALSVRPADRYATALDLAADLKRWLADEPVVAHGDPLPVRARRWSRRHPRLVAGTAASLLMGFVALAALAAIVSDSNRRLADGNAKLADANAQIRDRNEKIGAQNDKLERTNRNLELARADADRERDQAEAVIAFLVESFHSPDPAKDGRTVTIAEVLDRAVEGLVLRDDLAPITRATILTAIGQTYNGLGLVGDAVGLNEQVVGILGRELGPDHPDTLSSQNNLAYAYYAASRLNEAIPLYERTLETSAAMLGPDHPDTLVTRNNLAAAYRAAGRVEEAIPLYELTSAAMADDPGADDTEALFTRNNLADAYLAASRLDEAIPLYERTSAAMADKFGADHSNTLVLQNNLAYAYFIAGRLDEAIPLYERTSAAMAVKLGPDHPNTLSLQNGLASAYQAAGRLDLAIPLFERTLEAERDTLGPGHRFTLAAQNNLARAYQLVGRINEAIPLFEQTAELESATLGPAHPNTLISRNNLAEAYEEAGRLEEAERVHRDRLEAVARRQPRDDGMYSRALAGLGSNLIAQRKHSEAEPILRESLELRERIAPDDWSTANTRSLLGEALAGLGRLDEAEPLLLDAHRALAERADAIPDKDRERIIREAVERLIRLYESWGRPEEAEAWRGRLPGGEGETSREAAPSLPAEVFAPATGR